MNNIRNSMKHVCFVLGLLALAGGRLSAGDLENDFRNPPAADRPATFAFMLPYGPVPDAVITRDLEAMKEQGLSSCLIYTPGANAGAIHSKGSRLIYGQTENRIVKTGEEKGRSVEPEELGRGNAMWSDEWRKTVCFAAGQAKRLGLELGLNIGGIGCELFDLPLEYSCQSLVVSSLNVRGPGKVDRVVPRSDKVRLKEDKTPEFYRDIAVLALPIEAVVQPKQVVDLTARMDGAGRLRWDAPAGDWVVLRFGHTGTRQVLDHLSAEALDAKWQATTGKLLREMTPEQRQGLKFLECDSYEGGAQQWTACFPEEFRKRRGYDILPWLPVLAKRVVGDAGQSARFQRDYELTISDLIADNHYARHTALARANGLRFFAEAAGPHQKQADMLKSLARCDVPMGEFWMPGTHRGVGEERRFLLRDAAAASHGYGMKAVLCEAFTGGNDPWRESPFQMKPCADQAYCDGLTRPYIHGWNFSPWLDGTPGVVYWAGTYLNRHVTWWDQSAAFFTYLARCSRLLRQGVFAADVAYYDGDGIGRVVPRKRAVPGDFVGLYDYDRINTEILLTRMSTRDGRLVLPDGLSYRLLAMANRDALPLTVLRKLTALVEAGATIVGERPAEPWGLSDDPAEFNRLADRLWGPDTPKAVAVRAVGRGRVIQGKSVRQCLQDDGVPPDFACTGVSSKGVIDWIHRTDDGTDIYFVSSRWQPVEQVECTFRVSGKIPELWDPVTGSIREAGAFRQDSGVTSLPLRLDPHGSVFVVFRQPADTPARSGKNWLDYRPVQELTGPWTVNFDTKWGGPRETTFTSLIDWTTHRQDGIKYFSGKATYRKSFTWTAPSGTRAPGQRMFLDLGDVREVAAARLNGHDLGTLWTKPFRADVTETLVSGTNLLEIDVVNLWPNRLIGDTFLPKDKRFTRTSMTKYTQTSPLLPSGLLGPVTLQTATAK